MQGKDDGGMLKEAAVDTVREANRYQGATQRGKMIHILLFSLCLFFPSIIHALEFKGKQRVDFKDKDKMCRFNRKSTNI